MILNICYIKDSTKMEEILHELNKKP